MSRTRILAASAVAGAAALGATAMAVTEDDGEVRALAAPPGPAAAPAELPVPAGWRVADARTENHDGTAVTVTRYERDGRRTLGAEHVSTVVARDGTLLGYTRMIAGASGELLPEDRAREAALGWLRRHAPEYARGLDVQWVDRHDERVRTPDGREHVVPGTKVKARHASGLYAWVIVDAAGRVVTYERDVRWDASAGRRGTEMWLHDTWVAAREGTGPQPAAPYAVA